MIINSTISLPGDKSISHRSIMLASIASGISHITNLNDGKDLHSTIKAMQSCGALIKQEKDTIIVTGSSLANPKKPIDCGNSGTTSRLLTGLLSSQHLSFSLIGDESLSKRPMNRVIKPLKEMGCIIKSNDGLLPLHIDASKRFNGIDYKMPIASAQVKSAIILAGLGANNASHVKELKHSRDHSEIMLESMGANIIVDGENITVNPLSSKLKSFNMDIPADPSSAAFFIALAALLKGSDLTVKNILLNPTRTGFIDVLGKMGVQGLVSNPTINNGESCGDIQFIGSNIKSCDVPAHMIPSIIDEIPILAVIAAFAKGRTVFHQVEELRFKESDRLDAIIQNLQSFGINAFEEKNNLIVDGGKPTKMAKILSFDDHRIAMAFIILSLVAYKDFDIDNTDCIDISLPGFFEILEEIQR
ncbi:MAG: 3-phosphoshikimate 1-carboxyvinyltransferase [Candidatus Marinimicrobia bacterium]|jgi:3-phosphoshikimate 1-carboxyvinyltransferase|nr:3-phosphoshikimate 1-carboxyvinyltransferase [Candidatus Neomarinimicrobiota bacterium]MDG2188755.1 3-phosphoshikimate 1-carboxyvinyltransferase [Candidatus Neomarinimicrobiota bacterium]